MLPLNKTSYNDQLLGVDIFKYIMALAVVAIHVSIGSCCGIPFPSLIIWFNNLAVPFFFITSGYLLARKTSEYDNSDTKAEMIRKRAIKIFRLFGLWLLIYMPLSFTSLALKDVPVYKIIKDTLIAILCRGEMACAYPLWYLYSLALTTLAISFIIKHPKYRSAYLIIVILASIGYEATLVTNLHALPRWLFLAINALPLRALGGGIYIIAGMYIYKARQIIPTSWIYPLILIFISLGLSFANIPLNKLIGGIALFHIANLIKITNKSEFCLNLRNQSMWIYYLHMYIIYFVVSIAHYKKWSLELWPTYITVATATMIIAAGVAYLQKRPKFTYLQILTK